jgi:hypothetical protein
MVLTVLLGVGALVTSGCAQRSTSLDADTGTTASSSSESGQDLDESESSTSTSTSASTTDTDTGESETETDTGDDTHGFVPMTDAYGEWCMCDPWSQDCPEGEKCIPYAQWGEFWDCTQCLPIVGDRAVGEPCSYDGLPGNPDNCDADGFCFTAGSEGTCLAFCDGTIDDYQCDPGTTCIIMGDGSVTLCMPECNPLVQDCGEGSGCFWLETGFACMYIGGGVQTGQPCGALNVCEPGNFCAPDQGECGGESCCVAFCDLNNPVCTTMGTECVPFFELDMVPDGYDDVGACLSLP